MIQTRALQRIARQSGATRRQSSSFPACAVEGDATLIDHLQRYADINYSYTTIFKCQESNNPGPVGTVQACRRPPGGRVRQRMRQPMSHVPLSTTSRLSSLKLAEIDPAELRLRPVCLARCASTRQGV